MKCIFCGGKICFLHDMMAESYSRAEFIFGACGNCGWRTLGKYESEEPVKEVIHKWFASLKSTIGEEKYTGTYKG